MHKRLGLILLFCIGNGIVASDAGQQNSEKATSPACCLKMQDKLPVSNYGIDVDAPDRYGFTDLQHAVVQGKSSAIGWLLENGANVNRVNNAGATSITLALQNRDRNDLMLLRLLRHSPSLDTVQDSQHEKSPKEVLASLRSYCSPGPGMCAGADLLEFFIEQETRRRMKSISRYAASCTVGLTNPKVEN